MMEEWYSENGFDIAECVAAVRSCSTRLKANNEVVVIEWKVSYLKFSEGKDHLKSGK